MRRPVRFRTRFGTPVRREGFALPAILIASVVMLMVLSSALVVTAATTAALRNQHYGLLARQAAESGVVMAEACLAQSDYVPQWTAAKPLTTSTDCAGNVRAECASGCWLLKDGLTRSTFSVPPPTGGSGSLRLTATATVELLRASSGTVWRSYAATQNVVSNLVTTPQLGGGAGWKGSGHLGFFVSADGNLYAWGDNRVQEIGPSSLGEYVLSPTLVEPPAGETKVRSIASAGQGASIICAIFVSGNAYCRGTPGDGNNSLMPTQPGWARFAINPALRATQIVVNGYGGDSVCAVASDQQAYCAGDNHRGRLGVGDETHRLISEPARLVLPAGVNVTQVFTQDWHSCVRSTDNRVFCSGPNDAGQLGDGTTTSRTEPVQAPFGEAITDVKTTYHTSGETIHFLAANGNLYGAGLNRYGTLNDGGSPSNAYSTPQLLRTGVGAIISIGERADTAHALCALDAAPAAGTSGVWCMGDNTYGQIGAPCGTRKPTWTQLPLGGAQADAVRTRSAGYQMNSVMIIARDGRAFAWGDNTYGKLGTTHSQSACNPDPRPVQLPAGSAVQAVVNVDEYSSSLLTNTASVYTMGRNNVGQLGTGNRVDTATPRSVPIARTTLYF